jgi:hypothetical protein
MKIAAVLLLVVLLGACSTTSSSVGPEAKRDEIAVLEIKLPNVLRLAAGQGAAVDFVELDGEVLKHNILLPPLRRLEVAPGKHRVTLLFRSGSLTLSSGQFTTEVEVKAGGRYWLTADVVGMDYDLSIWDVTSGEEARVLVKKDRTEIRKQDRIQVMTISPGR